MDTAIFQKPKNPSNFSTQQKFMPYFLKIYNHGSGSFLCFRIPRASKCDREQQFIFRMFMSLFYLISRLFNEPFEKLYKNSLKVFAILILYNQKYDSSQMEKDLKENQTKANYTVEPGSLQQQDNLLIQMLTSDKIVDIAIFVSFLGVIILSLCCYLVEGHLRIHLAIILFLMAGLAVSLMTYKCLNSKIQEFVQQDEQSKQKDQNYLQHQTSKQQLSQIDKQQKRLQNQKQTKHQ